MAADTRMGDKLSRPTDGAGDLAVAAVSPLPWLDDQTSGYLRRVVAHIARQCPEAMAAILFGSAARREERPLDDPRPSDVDLLVLFEPRPGQDELTSAQHQAISWAEVTAFNTYPDPPRDVQVTGALTHLAHWDPMFVENVARDGLLLWARGPLPPPLAQVRLPDAPATIPSRHERRDGTDIA